ncbi:MAG TPA: carbohydrate binding family 9 domain-containing protein, partial [Dehalococcoidia bacterium]
MNEAVWQGVAPYTTFTQQDPIEGAPASERTEVRVIVGKGNVYVGIIAFDSDPSKIIVSQSRRDASLTETDSVVMVFDTFNDNQNAFVFGTNPLGIEYDGQVAREGQTSGVSIGGGGAGGTQRGGISAFNPNWDGDWTVKSQITERGWEAEMAIPLKTLRYQTGLNKTWGFNV